MSIVGEIERVAPHTGAWIEIGIVIEPFGGTTVAPHTGAWIEIKQ